MAQSFGQSAAIWFGRPCPDQTHLNADHWDCTFRQSRVGSRIHISCHLCLSTEGAIPHPEQGSWGAPALHQGTREAILAPEKGQYDVVAVASETRCFSLRLGMTNSPKNYVACPEVNL